MAHCLANVRRERRWPRKRVLGGFRVTAAGKPAAVVDVSYGGLRLEVPSGTNLAQSFPVELAGIGLQFDVQTVWSCPSANGNCTAVRRRARQRSERRRPHLAGDRGSAVGLKPQSLGRGSWIRGLSRTR